MKRTLGLASRETYSRFMKIMVDGNCIVAFKSPFLDEGYYFRYNKSQMIFKEPNCPSTAQKMKFFIKDFFGKCYQIRS